MAGLPEVVARNVRALREDRGWSQRELAELLDRMGGNWTRVAVTALESQGKRGRDALDLAALCWAFGVGVEELLAGDEQIDLPNGETVPLDLIRDALTGQVRDEIRLAPTARGRDEELTRIGSRLHLTAEQLGYVSMAVFGRSDFLEVRDERAEIDEGTQRRTAQARRGHATRALLAEIETAFEAEGRDVVLKRGEMAFGQAWRDHLTRSGHTTHLERDER